MKNILIALIILSGALCCNAQSFLEKYPELTKENLTEFIRDWAEFSYNFRMDALQNRAIERGSSSKPDQENISEFLENCTNFSYGTCREDTYNSVINEIFFPELTNNSQPEFIREWKNLSYSINNDTSRNMVVDEILSHLLEVDTANLYTVLPEYVHYKTLNCDIDTTKEKFQDEVFDKLWYSKSEFIPDSITPVLSWYVPVLYINRNIYKLLSVFIGAVDVGDGWIPLNVENLRMLRKYINTSYGHWGGYWWFESFPIIQMLTFFENLVYIDIRDNYCEGHDFLLFINDGKVDFKRHELYTWIE